MNQHTTPSVICVIFLHITLISGETFIATECFGSVLSLSCSSGHRIKVLDDFFGLNVDRIGTDSCQYVPNDCTVTNNRYTSVIHRYCEGKQTCTSFQVDRRACGTNLTNYEQVEYECVPDVDVLAICSTVKFETQNGYIATPNFPNEYPPNLYCGCSLKSLDRHNEIQLEFTHFIVKYDYPCKDWVELELAGQKRRLCGAYRSTLLTREVNITFHSDGQQGHQGLWLNFSNFKKRPKSKIRVECGPKEWTTTTTMFSTTTTTQISPTSELIILYEEPATTMSTSITRSVTIPGHQNQIHLTDSPAKTTEITSNAIVTTEQPFIGTGTEAQTQQSTTTQTTIISTTKPYTDLTTPGKLSSTTSGEGKSDKAGKNPMSGSGRERVVTAYQTKSYTTKPMEGVTKRQVHSTVRHPFSWNRLGPRTMPTTWQPRKKTTGPYFRMTKPLLFTRRPHTTQQNVKKQTTALNSYKSVIKNSPSPSWSVSFPNEEFAKVTEAEVEKSAPDEVSKYGLFSSTSSKPIQSSLEDDVKETSTSTQITTNQSKSGSGRVLRTDPRLLEELRRRNNRTTGIIIISICVGGIVLLIIILGILLCVNKRKHPKPAGTDKGGNDKIQQRLNSLSFYDSIPMYDSVGRKTGSGVNQGAGEEQLLGVSRENLVSTPTPSNNGTVPRKGKNQQQQNKLADTKTQSLDCKKLPWKNEGPYWTTVQAAEPDSDHDSAVYAELDRHGKEGAGDGAAPLSPPGSPRNEGPPDYAVQLHPPEINEDVYTHV